MIDGTETPPPPESPRRSLTLADAMILTAATAAGLGVFRLWSGPGVPAVFDSLLGAALILRLFATSLAFYWAIAVILIRLRRPRPSLRRLGRQPGLVACLAAVLSFLNHVLNAPFAFMGPRGDALVVTANMLVGRIAVHDIAPAVALAWIVLALSGGWEAEAGWVDRLGHGIGFLWLGLYAQLMIQLYWAALS